MVVTSVSKTLATDLAAENLGSLPQRPRITEGTDLALTAPHGQHRRFP
jgi:hypothetical protein